MTTKVLPNKRLLLVDDDFATREVMSMILVERATGWPPRPTARTPSSACTTGIGPVSSCST